MKRIVEWPQADRPRERLLSRGPDALTDTEVVALILGTGHAKAGLNAVDLARDLLRRFPSLAELASAGVGELTEVAGVGTARAVQLKAALELGRRLGQQQEGSRPRFQCSEDLYREYRGRLSPLKYEIFMVVLLDARNRRIKDVTIAQGSLTEAIVHPREVFLPVIRESAAGIVLLHNHPSGDPSPSREDLALTRRLRAIASLMGVNLIDHLILGADSYTSFVDRGLLGEPLEVPELGQALPTCTRQAQVGIRGSAQSDRDVLAASGGR